MSLDDTSAVNPTSVYRYYDRFDVLIYVGITGRGPKRNREHTAKTWWPLVVRQEVTHFQTRRAALEQESQLIRKHRPPFNKQQNRGGSADAYLTWVQRSAHPGGFAALYKRIGKQLPLIATDRTAKTMTLLSLPEHWAITRRLVVKDKVISMIHEGDYLGRITNTEMVGPSLWLTLDMKRPLPDNAVSIAGMLGSDNFHDEKRSVWFRSIVVNPKAKT